MDKHIHFVENFILTPTRISRKAFVDIMQIIENDMANTKEKELKIDIQAWVDNDTHNEAWVRKMIKKLYE